MKTSNFIWYENLKYIVQITLYVHKNSRIEINNSNHCLIKRGNYHEYFESLRWLMFRNNSAWNERFYVVSQSEGWKNPVVEREIKFALEKINMVSRNESAWNYLRVS